MPAVNYSLSSKLNYLLSKNYAYYNSIVQYLCQYVYILNSITPPSSPDSNNLTYHCLLWLTFTWKGWLLFMNSLLIYYIVPIWLILGAVGFFVWRNSPEIDYFKHGPRSFSKILATVVLLVIFMICGFLSLGAALQTAKKSDPQQTTSRDQNLSNQRSLEIVGR